MRCMVLACPVLAASTDAAQAVPDEAMEAQRCIWRCGDATSLRRPAYDRCVARRCDAAPKTRKRRQPGAAAPR